MDFIDWCIIEQCSSSWTEKGNDSINLRTNFLSDKLLFSSWPDGKDASNSEVINNNWTSIQWVESYIIAFALSVEFFQFRSLFTSKTFNEWVLFQMLFNDLISMNILLELSVTKFVSWLKNYDRRMSKEESNFSCSVKNGLNNWSFRTSELWFRVVHFWIVL